MSEEFNPMDDQLADRVFNQEVQRLTAEVRAVQAKLTVASQMHGCIVDLRAERKWLSEQKAGLTELANRKASLDSQIAKNETELAGKKQLLTSLQTQVAAEQSRLASVKDDVAAVERHLESLKTEAESFLNRFRQ